MPENHMPLAKALTSDKEQTALELLQEHDTAATELPCQEDEDGAGHDGALELCAAIASPASPIRDASSALTFATLIL